MDQTHPRGFARRFAEFVLARRWLVMLASLLLVMAAASGGQFLAFKNNYRIFFGPDNPDLLSFERFQQTFSRDDNVMIVVQPQQGSVFNPRTFALLHELTEASWKTPYSGRVDSLTNFQHTFAGTDEDGEDMLVVRDLMHRPAVDLSAEDYAAIEKVAMEDPLLKDRLVSGDGRTTGVYITIRLDESDPNSAVTAGNFVRARLAEIAAQYPDHSFALSGTVMLNMAFAEASLNDFSTLIPAMIVILLLAVGLFLRSISAVFATLVLILLSVAAGMGLAGWIGFPMTPPLASAPTVIMTLAVADSIHLMVTMLKRIGQGASRREALIQATEANLQPMFLTSLTTAIGFLALNASDAPPFQHLGTTVTLGITTAFLLSVTLLPALLTLLPIGRRARPGVADSVSFGQLADWVLRQRVPLSIGMALVVGGLSAATLRLELNDEFVRYFSPAIKFRTDTEFMIDNLTGIYQIEFPITTDMKALETEKGAAAASEWLGISEPVMARSVEEFSTWLRQQPEVLHVYSITDILKRLNRNFNQDDPLQYRLAESRDLNAQYLLMYDNSMRQGMELTDRISTDRTETRITVTLVKGSTTNAARDLEARAVAWFKETQPRFLTTLGTGTTIMFSHISDRNIESNLWGNAWSFGLIALAIGLVLGSARLGAISLIPNVVPTLMAFGVWSFIHGRVNMGVAVVASIALGIVVDDTIHMLTKYQRARRDLGLSAEDAIRYAFREAGPAISVTTVVLIAGFGLLAFSNFAINAYMGLLTAIAFFLAIFLDLLMLPLLLLYFDRRDPAGQQKPAPLSTGPADLPQAA